MRRGAPNRGRQAPKEAGDTTAGLLRRIREGFDPSRGHGDPRPLHASPAQQTRNLYRRAVMSACWQASGRLRVRRRQL